MALLPAVEAQPLHEELERIQRGGRRGPQPLADILPIGKMVGKRNPVEAGLVVEPWYSRLVDMLSAPFGIGVTNLPGEQHVHAFSTSKYAITG